MFSQVLRDIARPSYSEILEALKRSDGMAISELSKELNMSYMGVKQHCVNLEKKGYLETWRVPRKQVGRPEKLYRLTSKCDELFPQAGVGLTLAVLKGVQQVYGESAPEKLLFHYYETLRAKWGEQMSSAKSLVEKAVFFTDLRDKEGCFSRCAYDKEGGLRIEEYHHPLKEIFEVYPSAERMELQFMEKVLGTRVTRRIADGGKGRKRVIYELSTLGVERPSGATGTAQREVNGTPSLERAESPAPAAERKVEGTSILEG